MPLSLFIINDGVLYIDGHPSYPIVPRNLNLRYNIVNHSTGVRAIEVIHTKNIEGYWVHIKTTMRKEYCFHKKTLMSG